MRLDRLLGGVDVLETVGNPAAVEISAVAHDSRAVGSGTLFCCVPGATVDGHDFAGRAVTAGAVALLCDHVVAVPTEVVQARVAEVRPAMAAVAAAFFGHPAEHMDVVGVTGTNGKTTVTHMVASILDTAGRPTAVVGTLSGARTTPEAPELQELLAHQRAAGMRGVAMEVSSHALVQHRVDAMVFGVAVFTNLSHDHLDYHGTMEAYFDAKAALFTPERSRSAVVNLSDEWGRRLATQAESGGLVVYPYREEDARSVRLALGGSDFVWRGRDVHVPMGGRINVMNALAAATATSALGVADDVVAAGLAATPPVPGRMEVIEAGQPFGVVVDYAHTPDGLARVLASVRATAETGARVAVVFGAGGQRDRAKRPLMGRAATRGADLVVVTDDNPRDEDPAAIVAEIVRGVDAGGGATVVERDRRVAIARALSWARPGDVVVLAGKGHETGQDVAGVVTPFDDRVVARQLLAELAGPGGGSGR